MGGRKRKRRGDGEHEEKAADPPATPERDNWRQALFGDVKAADGLFNCRLCSYVPRGRRGRRDNRRAPQERHAANLGAALAGLFSGVGLSAADVHEYDTDMLDELEALSAPSDFLPPPRQSGADYRRQGGRGRQQRRRRLITTPHPRHCARTPAARPRRLPRPEPPAHSRRCHAIFRTGCCKSGNYLFLKSSASLLVS